MIEVADVFRRFAAGFTSRLTARRCCPRHRRAIEDILTCRTRHSAARSGAASNAIPRMFSWHSCANRSCPKCHTTPNQGVA